MRDGNRLRAVEKTFAPCKQITLMVQKFSGKDTFRTVEEKVKKLQKEFNEKIKATLSNCEEGVQIGVNPPYLNFVDINDGYPIQLNVWKARQEQPKCPIFGG